MTYRPGTVRNVSTMSRSRPSATVVSPDAATGATIWRAGLDRPVDELSAIRYEIAEKVAATMFDAGLREQAARAGQSSAPASFSKPLPQ